MPSAYGCALALVLVSLQQTTTVVKPVSRNAF